MNQRERMLAGLPYKAWLDGLAEERLATKIKLAEYNAIQPHETQRMRALLKAILGKTGKQVWIEQPFRCDYGMNIEVGESFFANYNFVVLDVGRVIVGSHVQIAPNVAIYTAGHPIHHQSRNSGYEYGIEVTIGDNVWIGGNVVINPGVHIGKNTVIGAGSIVTKDIPASVVAVGNPCRVIKTITEADRKFYFKDRMFDVDDYLSSDENE